MPAVLMGGAIATQHMLSTASGAAGYLASADIVRKRVGNFCDMRLA